MAKDPAVLFYTSDFLTGTMTMNNEQVGKYIRLLCLQHQKGVLSEKDMLFICGSYDADIFSKFKKNGIGFYNERLREEAEKRAAYSASRALNRSKNKKKFKKHMKDTSKTYDAHMENENENINEDININKISSMSEKFGIFWTAYPKKKSKGQAERAFSKINPDEQLLAKMIATIERAKKSEDWVKEKGKYIPYPATWLNAKGWEDEEIVPTLARVSPYVICERCGAEVLKDNFIVDGGIQYCPKCPRILEREKTEAKKQYEKIGALIKSIGKEMPPVAN